MKSDFTIGKSEAMEIFDSRATQHNRVLQLSTNLEVRLSIGE